MKVSRDRLMGCLLIEEWMGRMGKIMGCWRDRGIDRGHNG